MPGGWKSGNKFNTPLMCPIPEWCIGGALGTSTSICAPGHDQAYPYCSVCLGSFYKSIQKGCLKCEGGVSPEAVSPRTLETSLVICRYCKPYNKSNSTHTYNNKTYNNKTYSSFHSIYQIGVFVGGGVLVFVLYYLFQKMLGLEEQKNVKSILRILFIAGQSLVKFPFTFAIAFPNLVSTGQV